MAQWRNGATIINNGAVAQWRNGAKKKEVDKKK
jgi:hypothetical protein